MNKAESMGLIKVVITDYNCGFKVGDIVYWDKNRITDAKMNGGNVVWNGDMTKQLWQNPNAMKVLVDEGTGNG